MNLRMDHCTGLCANVKSPPVSVHEDEAFLNDSRVILLNY
jgi:hypothetical protein